MRRELAAAEKEKAQLRGAIERNQQYTQALISNLTFLRSTLPERLGLITDLQILDLSRNRLTGAIRARTHSKYIYRLAYRFKPGTQRERSARNIAPLL